jgi:type VI protein secretion system component VasK
MGPLEFFSLLIRVWLAIALVCLLVLLAWIPGAIARKRGHPWAKAINIAGWVGIFVFPAWIMAMAAAYFRPRAVEDEMTADSTAETPELAAAIRSLSQHLDWLENEFRAHRATTSTVDTHRA